MKNRTHLLLLGAILPLGLASCGSTPGGEGGSTPKEKGYTVSEAYWTKNITNLGYFGADANLTMDMEFTYYGDAATGAAAEKEDAVVENANGKLHIDFIYTEVYFDPLTDGSFDVYGKTKDGWQKRNVDPATYAQTIELFTTFIRPWIYNDFAYNEETHAYVKESDEFVAQGSTVTLSDIAFKFEDGNLLSLTYHASDEDGEYDFVLTGSKWGTTTVTIPTIGPAPEGASISLSESAVTVYEGTNYQLTATVSPDDPDAVITWTLDKDGYAHIDRHAETARTINIKAEEEGVVTITATLANGASASCVMTIEKDPSVIIPATGVTLSAESLDLKVGDITAITATLSPNDTTDTSVIWTCTTKNVINIQANPRNPLVADITAIGAGTTEIEAICHPGVEAHCTVTVTSGEGGDPIVEVTGITLSSPSLDMEVGDTGTLTATVEPKNATNKTVTWQADETFVKLTASKSDPNTVTLQALKAGRGTITAYIGKVKATCSVVISEKQGQSSQEEQVTVELDQTSVQLNGIGDSFYLNASVRPNGGDVQWSYDEALFRVEAQRGNPNFVQVTALGQGTGVITATYGEASASCTVVIGHQGGGGETPEFSVELSADMPTMSVGSMGLVRATISPEDASGYRIQWSCSAATLQITQYLNNSKDVMVKALAPGEGFVTITLSTGATATCRITING